MRVEMGLWVLWILLILWLYLFIRFIFMKDSFRRIERLLLDTSEDINEIKEKMGLNIYRRSDYQVNEMFWRAYIKDKVFEGKIRPAQMKRELGSKIYNEYHWWIDYCISKFYRAYPRTKRCPTCWVAFSEFFDSCWTCNTKLIPIQESYVMEIKEEKREGALA